MLYPKVTNMKKKNRLIKALMALSVLVAGICFMINTLVDKQLHWSFLCMAGIVYVWVAVIYSIKKNVNIASHVLIQALCASVLVLIIDKIFGNVGWAMLLAIPIIITIANSTMAILAIVSHKRYAKYAIYQMIIFVFSIIPMILEIVRIQKLTLPTILSAFMAFVTLIITIAICGKSIAEEITKRFHV